jgi:chlorobactene glucosyltransferase
VASSRRVEDKIANGQCILMRRVVYDAVGGHASVRDKVAEDLMLAQRTFIAGHRVEIVIGPEQLSTRMYTSLGELVRGWGKNIFAGAADAMPFGWVGRVVLLPLVLLVPWIAMLAPLTVLLLTVTGVIEQSPVPAAAAALLLAAMFGFIVRGFGLSPTYGLLYPVGAAAMLYIVTGAIVRGRSVGWKGREYRIGP